MKLSNFAPFPIWRIKRIFDASTFAYPLLPIHCKYERNNDCGISQIRSSIWSGPQCWNLLHNGYYSWLCNINSEFKFIQVFIEQRAHIFMTHVLHWSGEICWLEHLMLTEVDVISQMCYQQEDISIRTTLPRSWRGTTKWRWCIMLSEFFNFIEWQVFVSDMMSSLFIPFHVYAPWETESFLSSTFLTKILPNTIIGHRSQIEHYFFPA